MQCLRQVFAQCLSPLRRAKLTGYMRGLLAAFVATPAGPSGPAPSSGWFGAYDAGHSAVAVAAESAADIVATVDLPGLLDGVGSEQQADPA